MEEYDVIIVGGGVSGMGASIYSARFNLTTLILGGRIGGLIQDTHIVENYPGFKSISGSGLVDEFKKQVKSYKNIEIKDEFVKDIKKKSKSFSIETDKGDYESKTVIYATGTKRKKLEVPGGKEFENKGLSYCAQCDAPLFKDKIVGVIGGSDSAAKEALLLTEHAEKVYIIYRKNKIHPEPINLDRINRAVKKGKIEIINNTNVIEVKGEMMMSHVILDKEYNGSKEFKLDGLFVEIGHIVESDFAKKLGVELDDHGQIKIDKESRTNVDGFYAAGDVTDRAFKQAITGVAEGCVAANSAYEYIAESKVK